MPPHAMAFLNCENGLGQMNRLASIRKAADQASISQIGLPSAILIGRLDGVIFSRSGGTPRAAHKVASTSPIATSFFSTVVPSALVRPYACPPRIPPPANTHDHAAGK